MTKSRRMNGLTYVDTAGVTSESLVVVVVFAAAPAANDVSFSMDDDAIC